MMLDPQVEELLLVAAVAIGVVMLTKRRDRRLAQEKAVQAYPRRQEAPRHATPAALLKRPVLQGISGYYAGAVIPFDDTEWVIGSDSNVSNLVFPESVTGIAKRHCTLKFDVASGKIRIEDTWSDGGTYLADGTRLAGKAHRLEVGAQFYLANPEQSFAIVSAA